MANLIIIAIILCTTSFYTLGCKTEKRTQTEKENIPSLRSGISKELDSLILTSSLLPTNSTTVEVSSQFEGSVIKTPKADITKLDVHPVKESFSVAVTDADDSKSEKSEPSTQDIQINNFEERSIEVGAETKDFADTTLVYNTLVYPLAKIIYAESGNMNDIFQQYVGYVVLNRVDSIYYPNTIYDVFFTGDAYAESSRKRYRNEEVTDQCIRNAKVVVNQYLNDTIPVSPAMVFQAEFKQGVNIIKIHNTYFGHDQRIIDDLSDPEVDTP